MLEGKKAEAERGGGGVAKLGDVAVTRFLVPHCWLVPPDARLRVAGGGRARWEQQENQTPRKKRSARKNDSLELSLVSSEKATQMCLQFCWRCGVWRKITSRCRSSLSPVFREVVVSYRVVDVTD